MSAKPLPHKVTITVTVESPNVSDIELADMGPGLDPDTKTPQADVETFIRRTWGAVDGRAAYTVWDRQSDPTGKDPTRLVSGTVELGSPA